MAESIFKKLKTNVSTISCGTKTVTGMPITNKCIEVLREKNYLLSKKYSTSHLDADLEGRIIVCLSEEHKDFMNKNYKKNRIHLLSELGTGVIMNVEDPVRGDLQKYREVLGIIEEEVIQFASKIYN